MISAKAHLAWANGSFETGARIVVAEELQKSVGGRLVGRDHIRDLLWGLDVYLPPGR